MLPPSTSEYDNNASEHDHDDPSRAQADELDADDGTGAPGADELSDVDAELEAADDDLGEEEVKPKKKGVGKGVIFAGVGVGIVLALCGAAYVMQGQMQQAPVAKKIAVDPSLLESKPSLPAEPKLDAPVAANPNPLGAPASNEITPNLNGAPAPIVTTPSAAPSISSPPSDPFASTTSAASATPAAPAASAVVPPVVPAVTPTVTPPVATPAPGVSITPAPGNDPFGSLVPEKAAAKAEKPAPEKVELPVATIPVKPAKVQKPRPVEIEEVEITKPRPVAAKPRVKKPSVVRQDMTVSEPHPSQERVQPQSSESFHGYEKLF